MLAHNFNFSAFFNWREGLWIICLNALEILEKTVMIIILLILNILITEENLVWFPDSHAAGSGLGNQTFSKSDGDTV